jgi:asparagine synthase (glutamine-hydrolysing)
MCGIAGIIGPYSPQAGPDMVSSMLHRGPDDEGAWSEEEVFLGMRRLSILDREHGRQPMLSPDGRFVLVYNGEVYNLRELREDLAARGWRFRTRSDTEVVLYQLAEHGAAGLARLNGMFALALWDRRERVLLLARDHFGQKPLHYSLLPDGRLLFASETRALLQSGLVPRTPDPVSVLHFLRFPAVPPPRTMYAAIQVLPPATTMTFQPGGEPETSRFWSPELLPALEGDSRELAEEARRLLARAVERHLVADVPVGAFLSGGIDSTTLVALARQAGAVPLHTFSVDFDGEGDVVETYGEGAVAARSAAALGSKHHAGEVSAADFMHTLPAVLRAMDQPTGDGFNAYFVSRLAAREVTVALSGTGADELLAGYPWFGQLARTARAFDPASILRRLRWAGPGAVPGCSGKNFLRLYSGLRGLASRSEAWRMLSGEARQNVQETLGTSPRDLETEHLAALTGAIDGLDPIALTSRIMTLRELPDLLLRDTDAMSMAHSLEVRLPFLDLKPAEFFLRLPSAVKWREGVGKAILRDAVAGLIPEEVLHRPKMGFILPLDRWLAGPLRAGVEALLEPQQVRRRGLLDPVSVERVRREFYRGSGPFRYQRLWNLVVLELWFRTHVEGIPDAAAILATAPT